MTPDRWRHITEIFHAALAREREGRLAFVATACGDDASLRREVEQLLAGHEQERAFGEQPLFVAARRLDPGSTIGSYRIDRLLDAGGMGEVYRATDTKLGRDVAIKVLPQDMAVDPERLARFTREAQLLATLNHPHIAAIYGVEDAGDVRALVLELVDGETLARRLSRAALPLSEALRYAQQIAGALAAAHARRIVHRDLKPSNVMITFAGTVKVLDFGLAKVCAGLAPGPGREAGTSATREGTIVGTPAYMSPEQARGQTVDRQTDIWAFGCVLYEMLAGTAAFGGRTSTDTIAAVIDRDPDWSRLPATVPESIRALLHRCLEKDPAERVHDIADARLLIADAARMGAATVATRSRSHPRWQTPAIVLASGLVLAVVIWAWTVGARPQNAIGLLELTIPLSGVTPGYGLDVSPDGKRMAMGALVSNRAQIWLQPLDGSDSATLVPGDVGINPFWSPDNRSVGFVSGGKLWRMDPGKGPAVAICEAAGRGSGSWTADGQIIFAATGRLFRVSASGGTPQPLAVSDRSGDRGFRVWPQFLPDNRHFVYHVSSPAEQAVYLGSLDSPAVHHLVDSPFPAKYAAPGYLLFLRGAALMAQPLDARSQTLTGEATVLARDVAPGYMNGVPSFAASANGVLAFVPTRAGTMGRLTWFDRNGRSAGHVQAPPGVEYLNPAIAPNGATVAVNRMDPETGNWDVWTLDTAGDLPVRQTSDPAIDADPVWSSDGKSLAFMSYRDGTPSLYRKMLDGSAGEERLIGFDDATYASRPTDWSRDGRFIIYESQDQFRRSSDIWALPLVGERKPTPIVRNGFTNYGGRLSPNAEWLAYNSYEDGAFAIYVQRFPSGAQRTRVTSPGGVHPRWTDDGRTIVFWSEPGGLASVQLAFSESGLVAGPAKPLVSERVATLIDGRPHFDATRDGQRFLLRQAVGQPGAMVKILVNWTAKLIDP